MTHLEPSHFTEDHDSTIMFHRMESQDVLYQFLREDRNEALAQVVSLEIRNAQLEEQLRTGRPAQQTAGGGENSAVVADLTSRLEPLQRENAVLRTDLQGARNEVAVYQDALAEARSQLESTSDWGHSTVGELAFTNAQLHQQQALLRKQRKLRHKLASRIRWEQQLRATQRLETPAALLPLQNAELPSGHHS